MKRKNRGFTLLELLVVIAIIGLLSLLLAPAMAKARGSANTVSCMNSVLNVIRGMIMYADDHEEVIPTVPEIANYIDDPDIFICPRDTRDGIGASKPSFTTWAETPLTLKPADTEGIYSQNVVIIESEVAGISEPSEIVLEDITYDRHHSFTNAGCLDGRVWTVKEEDLRQALGNIPDDVIPAP